MRLGTIAVVIGLVLSVLGGLWYWQLMKVAVGFAGTDMASYPDRTLKLAGGIVCLGVALIIIGVAALLLMNEGDD